MPDSTKKTIIQPVDRPSGGDARSVRTKVARETAAAEAAFEKLMADGVEFEQLMAGIDRNLASTDAHLQRASARLG